MVEGTGRPAPREVPPGDDGPIDIRSTGKGLARALSNFAPYPFDLDGITCSSMEGFLQSLKIEAVGEQAAAALLPPAQAYQNGQRHDWKPGQTLWWRGRPLPRGSQDYQDLLDRAYGALAEQSADFRAALMASAGRRLLHSLGKSDPADTVLTRDEMTTRLEALRARLLTGGG